MYYFDLARTPSMLLPTLMQARPWPHALLLGALALVTFLTLVMFSQPVLAEAENSAQRDWHYTYRPSDSLQDIAKRLLNRGHNWTELVRYNRIAKPDNIRPGSIIKIPMDWLKFSPVPAKALSVDGVVMHKKARSTRYKTLKSSTKLHVGDEVMSRNGTALIQLADQSIIRLEKDSHIRFNKLSHFGETGMVDTRIRLNKGSLINQVAPLVKGSRYEVSTPSAVAAVRGTEFRIRADANSTVLEVTKGEVLFSGPHGEQMVPAGKGATIKRQSALIARHELLPAPEVELLNSPISSLPATLSWRPLNGANGYKYELVSREQGEVFVLKEGLLATPELTIDQLKNGDYQVLMSAIDTQGIEGISAVSDISIAQTGEPATLITPEDGSTHKLDELEFSWQEAANSMSKLQIAKDAQFKSLVMNTGFAKRSRYSKPIDQLTGLYYWRVISLNHGQIETPSTVRQFTLRGELGSPQILSVNYVKNQAGLFWNKVPMAKGYLLQVASDSEFTLILREQEIQKTSAFLKLNQGKSYYARVKALGSDAYDSNFGPSTELNFNQRPSEANTGAKPKLSK